MKNQGQGRCDPGKKKVALFGVFVVGPVVYSCCFLSCFGCCFFVVVFVFIVFLVLFVSFHRCFP